MHQLLKQQPCPLCRQHCSTQPIIKIPLMPLPDSPPLYHYVCCYLKWTYDNEMLAIEDTLNCSYGGLVEEICDIPFIRVKEN